MHLVIRAVSLGGAALTQALSGRFDEVGGTLGRSDDNTLTLPDPKRHISRQQAKVSHDARGYAISNIGSANPIVLNDRPVAPGESATLADGDELQIGSYRLRVSAARDEANGTVVLPRAAAAPAAHLPGDFSFGAAVPAPAPPARARAELPGNDPMDLLRPVGAAHAGAVDHLIGAPRGGDAVLDFLQGGQGGQGGRAQSVSLPAALLADPAPQPPPMAAFTDRTPAQHAAMPLPSPAEVGVDVDVTAPAALAPRTAAAGDALWAAFCEGTGVPLAPPQGLNPELMRVIGQLLRHLVGGTVQLVRLRAETKNELRFPATMLRTHGNNPLRYSPNVQAALTQILQPPLSGFMPGPQAAQEAMDDLFAHAVGTMTGMRAAIEGVLERFDPPRLEAQIVGGQVLDALLPMHRRARLWDLYLQHVDAVRAEAKEDFDRLFGQAFVGAYEQQLDRLDAERRERRERSDGREGREEGHGRRKATT